MTPDCPCCAANLFERLIAFEALPPTGLFRSSAKEQLAHFTLRFELCTNCGLVRQGSKPPPKDYAQIDRAAALKLPQHAGDLISALEHKGINHKDLILEVGSNEGTFLEALRSAGYTNLIGVEPSIALAEHSRGKGFSVINDYFGAECSAGIVQKFGMPRAIVCRHTVEHVPDPFTFVAAMRTCIAEKDGVLLIELPDGSAIPELLNVYELWDEHLCYFSSENAALMLARAGFAVTENLSYPYLDTRNIVLWAHPGQVQSEIASDQRRHLEKRIELWRKMPGAWRRVTTEMERQLRAAPKPVYSVGASHSQTNFFGFADLGGSVDFMVDDDARKVGKVPPIKGGAPAIISTAQFESSANRGTVVLTGFGYSKWTQRIRSHARNAGMKLIDPEALVKAEK